ncbi:MAG: DUF983 domain-containing protein [Sphingobacteriaceae bacterium]|nr:DUF983 domain-containing protein [Sphingobacteriaceae bacterium]
MKIAEVIYSTTANKCPRCHTGKVFSVNNPFLFNKSFQMEKDCTSCNLHYDREPGFFYGAMYVSYALTVAILVIWFISDLLWMHLAPEILFGIVVLNVLILFPIIFRWSRIIWLNFFYKYNNSVLQKQNN